MDITTLTSTPYDFIYNNLSDEEGVKHIAYLDTRGITTCGIGHNCSENPTTDIIGRNVKVGQSITSSEIQTLFNHDIQKVLLQLQDLSFFKNLTFCQQYVLISMTFNMGYDGLIKFQHFLNALENKCIQTAKDELKNSLWYKQVGDRGQKLVNMISL